MYHPLALDQMRVETDRLRRAAEQQLQRQWPDRIRRRRGAHR